ncbi:hypothetical protein CDAR_100891 [Caerostris darwini]|uniref:Uncharacterized protein n=1 Tax=Caerostris darwini TaxID=1538125 RepID=A0AAV4VVN4_9ARAC|nr:hypothetical protein CDAR_100891 [Caerostris darwini]
MNQDRQIWHVTLPPSPMFLPLEHPPLPPDAKHSGYCQNLHSQNQHTVLCPAKSISSNQSLPLVLYRRQSQAFLVHPFLQPPSPPTQSGTGPRIKDGGGKDKLANDATDASTNRDWGTSTWCSNRTRNTSIIVVSLRLKPRNSVYL